MANEESSDTIREFRDNTKEQWRGVFLVLKQNSARVFAQRQRVNVCSAEKIGSALISDVLTTHCRVTQRRAYLLPTS